MSLDGRLFPHADSQRTRPDQLDAKHRRAILDLSRSSPKPDRQPLQTYSRPVLSQGLIVLGRPGTSQARSMHAAHLDPIDGSRYNKRQKSSVFVQGTAWRPTRSFSSAPGDNRA